jgi:hypothetical protein
MCVYACTLEHHRLPSNIIALALALALALDLDFGLLI